LTQTALATVFFLADAEATVNRLYNGADPQIDVLNYDDVLVRLPMSFDIRDGSVTAGRVEDEATVSLPPDGPVSRPEPGQRRAPAAPATTYTATRPGQARGRDWPACWPVTR
jgi:hypothetical protein